MESKIRYVLIMFLMIIMVTMAFITFNLYQNLDMCYAEQYGEKINLFYGGLNVIEGRAYGNYIIVYTKGRSFAETLEICAHEWFHNERQLVDYDNYIKLKEKCITENDSNI